MERASGSRGVSDGRCMRRRLCCATEPPLLVRIGAPRKPAGCRFVQPAVELVACGFSKRAVAGLLPPKGLGGLIQAHLHASGSPSRTTTVLAHAPQEHKQAWMKAPTHVGAATSTSEERGLPRCTTQTPSTKTRDTKAKKAWGSAPPAKLGRRTSDSEGRGGLPRVPEAPHPLHNTRLLVQRLLTK